MFRGLRPRIAVAVALLAWLLAAVPGSAAAGSPLHVDPSSPVAKAYALPLGNARGTGSGGGRSAALFGSGLTSRAPSRAQQRSLRAAPAAYRVLEPGSGTSVLWMASAAVMVLGIGAAAAVLLGRRR